MTEVAPLSPPMIKVAYTVFVVPVKLAPVAFAAGRQMCEGQHPANASCRWSIYARHAGLGVLVPSGKVIQSVTLALPRFPVKLLFI